MVADSGGEAIEIIGDVSNSQDTERLAAATLGPFERIDILGNNAAIFARRAHIADIDEVDWDHVMRVNLRGPSLCSKFVILHMKRQGEENIRCVSSVSGVRGHAPQADYNTSKHGLIDEI